MASDSFGSNEVVVRHLGRKTFVRVLQDYKREDVSYSLMKIPCHSR